MLRLEVERRMFPAAEGQDLESIVQAVLHNIARFDFIAYCNWIGQQPWAPKTRKLAMFTRPANKIYRIVSDDEKEGRDAPVLLGCAVGYEEGTGGGPPLVRVWILGVLEGAGSYADPIAVPSEALIDVTERVRAGELRSGLA